MQMLFNIRKSEHPKLESGNKQRGSPGSHIPIIVGVGAALARKRDPFAIREQT